MDNEKSGDGDDDDDDDGDETIGNGIPPELSPLMHL